MATTEVEALKASITPNQPFCSGTVALSPKNAVVFYKQGDKSNRVDLSQPTDHELQSLAEACNPATFGVDQRDVLDETYRKAGKMDNTDFAPTFDLGQVRLIDRIRAQLLSGSEESKSINAELYKLNVYGKDSFFKAHKDTPRSAAMFGSLVVVYPTPHEGGALVLRHGGQEWTFDSAEAIRGHEGPAVAYVAFFSDVEHEVAVVKSGYRVTLTYNLYFADEDTLPALEPPAMPGFEGALADALKNPAFLPNGGLLGFGLAFMYPISPGSTVLDSLLGRLKGNDAAIKRACDHLSLDVTLKAIYLDEDQSPYNGYKHSIMVGRIPDLGIWGQIDEAMTSVLRESLYGGQVIHDMGTEVPKDWNGKLVNGAIEVLWISPLTDHTQWKSLFIAYGNDASIGCIYGDICLMVRVGPADQRATKPI